MQMYIYFGIINLFFAVSDTLFLFGEKEPIFLCFKICPLYCSPRRHDIDSSSLIYIDDEPLFHDRPYYYDDHSYSHSGYYVFCKHEPKPTTPKPTTTTMATTTEEPTWICMVCMEKCNTKAKSKRK